MTRAVPWNSKEFHGTWSAPISMTRVVPWNSKEFIGTSSAPISMSRAVPWNSMKLEVRQFRWHEQFHGIPWNIMELQVRQFHWHEQFHGTWGAPISMTRAVPWNSMEFGLRQFRWHEQFHGIPWNLEWANFVDTSSFHIYICIYIYPSTFDCLAQWSMVTSSGSGLGVHFGFIMPNGWCNIIKTLLLDANIVRYTKLALPYLRMQTKLLNRTTQTNYQYFRLRLVLRSMYVARGLPLLLHDQAKGNNTFNATKPYSLEYICSGLLRNKVRG